MKVKTDQESPYGEVIWTCEDHDEWWKLIHENSKCQMLRKTSTHVFNIIVLEE